MTTVLVTGFEPFGRWTKNPSGDLAVGLPIMLKHHPFTTHGEVLPVSWTDAVPKLRAAVFSYQPDILVLLGVASSAEIWIEVMAKNVAAPLPDNAGKYPQNHGLYRIDGEKPVALFTKLPLESLIYAPSAAEKTPMRQPPISSIPSFDAGAYLCNFVFFHALSEFPDISSCGFIHVPPYAEENPTMGADPGALQEAIAGHIVTIVEAFES